MKRHGDGMRRIAICVGLVAAVSALGEPAGAQDPVRTAAMVKQMLEARRAHQAIPLLTTTFGAFSVDEAYAIQDALTKELTRTLGPVSGYKVAYASKAAQEQFGMSEPASGPLFLVQRTPNGTTLSSRDFLGIVFETEVAFTIGKRIDRPVRDVAELKLYVRWAHPAFDIGESRFQSGPSKPTAADMIASGTGAHFHVVGPGLSPEAADVDGATLRLERNGELLRESPASNVMGSPWNSLLWLANSVVARGGSLAPGMIVSTGTAAPAYKATGDGARGRYVGDCGPLGRVAVTVE